MKDAIRLLISKPALPFMLGALCMTVSGGYLAASMFAEGTIGRPSSTFGLGYIQVPVAAFAFGASGFAIGIYIDKLVKKRLPSRENIITLKSPLVLIPFIAVLLFALISSAKSGYKSVIEFENRSKPHVISSDGMLSKFKNLPYSSPSFHNSVKTWDLSDESDNVIYLLLSWLTGQKKSPSIKWNNSQVTVVSDSDVIVIRDHSGRKIARTDLKKYNYTREVWAVPVRLQVDKPEYLAVLANLRSTSHREMLLVYSPEGSLIYHEILERMGCEPIMRKATDLVTRQESIEVKTQDIFYLAAAH